MRTDYISRQIPAGKIEMQFEGDDGTLAYARAAGIYVDGLEAPLFADRITSRPNPTRRSVTILTFGQSNAANTGGGRYTAGNDVTVFNVFDMKHYRAVDPLPGASNDGAAVWGRLGDKLVAGGHFESVAFVPIAVGGTFIRDWATGGPLQRRLMFALSRLKMADVKLDAMCWHQGESDANLSDMTAAEYGGHFLTIANAIRKAGIAAPIYVALATLCATADHPFKNRDQIRLGQKRAVSFLKNILPGPDTDLIGLDSRLDGCHFSESGLERHAEAWLQALTTPRISVWKKMAQYRLGATC